MYKNTPKPIDVVLDKLFTELGLHERYKRSKIISSWEEIVGEQIAKVATAERVVGKKLFVHVSSSTWRHELHLRKKEIVYKINRHIGEKLIEDIKFQ